MPADYISTINSNFLNQISSDVFPGIQADMEGGLRGGDFHWQVGGAPTFDLSHHGAQVFTVEFPVYTSTKQPGGGTAQTASVKTQVTVGISVVAQGELQLFAQNFIFHTQDKTLLADLNAAKTDISFCIDGLLEAVQLPIANVKGVSFNGFSAEVINGALILAASVSGSPAIQSSPAFFQDMGFAFSRTLLEDVLKNSFWLNVPKSIPLNGNITIYLNRYSLNFAGSRVILSLFFSGKASASLGFGSASYDIKMSPINVNLAVKANRQNQIMMSMGGCPIPTITIEPQNVGASITPSAVSSAIFNQVRNGFNGVIMGELRGNLNGMIGTIPSATKKVLNQNVIISAKNLMTQVKGNEVDFLGDGRVKV